MIEEMKALFDILILKRALFRALFKMLYRVSSASLGTRYK